MDKLEEISTKALFKEIKKRKGVAAIVIDDEYILRVKKCIIDKEE